MSTLSTLQTPQIDSHRSFSDEIIKAQSSYSDLKVIGFDFDGTLVEEVYPHSNRFEAAKQEPREVLEELALNPDVIPCLSTACSFGEARTIVSRAFHSQGRPFYGFSSSEHGAVLFCPKLDDSLLEILGAHGYAFETVTDELGETNVITLAKHDASYIRENIILPSLATVDTEMWASSTCDISSSWGLERLRSFSGHTSIEWTELSAWRFGSAYVKISAEVASAPEVIQDMIARAAERGLYAIETKPKANYPFYTVDISPGTDKGEALKLSVKLLALLTNRSEDSIAVSFFGNGHNDFAAFDYVSQHPHSLGAFLVDNPTGTNDTLAQDKGCHADFMKGMPDIHGVRAGLRRLGLVV